VPETAGDEPAEQRTHADAKKNTVLNAPISRPRSEAATFSVSIAISGGHRHPPPTPASACSSVNSTGAGREVIERRGHRHEAEAEHDHVNPADPSDRRPMGIWVSSCAAANAEMITPIAE
jgi:hypothetical protein